MGSFLFKNAAGIHDVARSKPSDSSYINLRELSSNSIAGHVQKTSTSATYDREMKLAELDFPTETLVESYALGRSQGMV